ncbi:DUF805 domain-containing protein [Streptomyces sp. NBC_00647]|uniref:DUF805 domain-containing protein n=1 Tax=Streptomyces sp. NBC_00647 TaxID=2975796 RepID=UPI00324D7ACC
MHWYVDALRKYATFGGRARRAEYWMFGLVNYAIGVVLLAAGAALDLGPPYSPFALFWLAMFLPALAVSVRRLHDTGRTGWWLLLGLIPVVGHFVLLVFHCTESRPGENEYGAPPKYIGAHV